MRRLFWQMNVTLDGFMEGPNRELNDPAQVMDEDFDRQDRVALQVLKVTTFSSDVVVHYYQQA
jgi:hypothetical protein